MLKKLISKLAIAWLGCAYRNDLFEAWQMHNRIAKAMYEAGAFGYDAHEHASIFMLKMFKVDTRHCEFYAPTQEINRQSRPIEMDSRIEHLRLALNAPDNITRIDDWRQG